ncbi:MAG: type II toxin-antitoxin system VapC family toxin [Chloroflexota bacterium]|nr:type II toxin-antitoxin system VapC family toxin [Chloroflexota bacterium]
MAVKLVVDSSVAVKWFISELNSTEARRMLVDAQVGTLTLFAPDLINAEVGNVVWRNHIKQGMEVSLAQRVITQFQEVEITLVPNKVLLLEAYHLAVTFRCTVYDAMYLALSARERCQFVTADKKLVNAVGSAMSNVVLLANWS